jgi:hypothetical protein
VIGKPRARQPKVCVNAGRINRMLERIRTFFGRLIGPHADKKTVVAMGSAWACTKCRLVFITKREGDKHECAEIYRDGV